MPPPAGPPPTIVVTGVSGVGKSAVAARIAARTGWPFLEGDDLHPAANRAAMAAGRPLDDAARLPWLRAVAAWISAREAAGGGGVVTCSALRRVYRDVLRAGSPSVRFVHLHADPAVLARRLEERRGHFMPATLLDSQLATLEPLADDEPGIRVLSSGTPDEVAARALADLIP